VNFSSVIFAEFLQKKKKSKLPYFYFKSVFWGGY